MHEQRPDASRPTSRIQQTQVLQKPNEVDVTTDGLTSPTTGSTTVYSSSTNEDNSVDHPIYEPTRTNR
jgi:hypothetical protein